MIRFHSNDRHRGEEEEASTALQCESKRAERASALARGLWSLTKACNDGGWRRDFSVANTTRKVPGRTVQFYKLGPMRCGGSCGRQCAARVDCYSVARDSGAATTATAHRARLSTRSIVSPK
jgi:hypothetical protein